MNCSFAVKRILCCPLFWFGKPLLKRRGIFDGSLHVAEDTQLIYRLAYANGIGYVNEALVKVNRKRSTPGLSDNQDPKVAAKRYDCYLRVQSEAYWRLLQSDSQTALHIKRNLAYFVSRRAELACVLGEDHFVRLLARDAIFLGGGLKCLLRALTLYFVPSLLRPRLRNKWLKSPDLDAAMPLR